VDCTEVTLNNVQQYTLIEICVALQQRIHRSLRKLTDNCTINIVLSVTSHLLYSRCGQLDELSKPQKSGGNVGNKETYGSNTADRFRCWHPVVPYNTWVLSCQQNNLFAAFQ
jgi:hypothetical protein